MDQDSPMTPEVLEHKLQPFIGEEGASSFVDQAFGKKVPATQVRELYGVLIDDYVATAADKKLEGLRKNIKREGAVDDCLQFLRNLKAMQPSQYVSLGKQTSAAVKLSFDGAKSLIRYGFPYMDHNLGGMTRGEITTLAGRPSHGKTTSALQFVSNQIRAGMKVVFFSIEMPTARLIQKMLSNRANIEFHKIRQGLMSDEEKIRMTETAEEFVTDFRDRLMIYDDVYSLNEMETIVAKQKPDVVVLDYIQLLGESAGIRFEIGDAMKRFKRMAKEYDMAPLILSQLNRSIENREDPRPRASDLAESGVIEQLSGTILFIWYPFILDNTKPRNRVEFIAAKTRYGTPQAFPFGFDGALNRYYQIRAAGEQIDLEENIARVHAEEGDGHDNGGEVQAAD
ncbi:MAG: DnaB-like helicase C-terminal domain-containing protein [Candidatus Thorarchaeota archaeon]